MTTYSCMTLNQELSNGDKVTSPLNLYYMQFSSTLRHLTVYCTSGGSKPIVTGFVAQNLQLLPMALALEPSGADIATFYNQAAGLDVLDSGNVVIYDGFGNPQWTWYYATGSATPPQGPELMIDANIVHVQEAIELIQSTFDDLRKKVAALQSAKVHATERAKRTKSGSGYPEEIKDLTGT